MQQRLFVLLPSVTLASAPPRSAFAVPVLLARAHARSSDCGTCVPSAGVGHEMLHM